MAYIGLDIGTSRCKGSLYLADGTLAGAAERAYALHTDSGGTAELDPQEIWEGVQEVLRELAPLCEGGDWLAVSGIGEAFVLADGDGRPLNRFVTYLDERGSDAVDELCTALGEAQLRRLTGLQINRTYSLVRLWWMREHQPELYARAASLHFFSEYFNEQLCGARAVDPSVAVRSMLARPDGGGWQPELVALMGLKEGTLAPILPPGTALGPIRAELARELGLPGDMKIALGVHDQCAATLGSGAWDAGDMMLGEGSSESLNLVASAAAGAAQRDDAVVAEPYFKGKRLLLSAQSTFGTGLRWLLHDIFGEPRDQDAAALYARWDDACPPETQLLFLPHLSALNVMDTRVRAIGGFLGLRFSTTRGEMYRAVLEGMHMETRRNLERMCGAQTLRTGRLIATGGNSRSPLSMQIKADVLQRRIETLESREAGGAGLAMIAAVASGAFADYPAAMERFLRFGRAYVPERSYEEKYRRYLRDSRALEESAADE